MRLPNDVIIIVGRFMHDTDRMRFYSSFHPNPTAKSGSWDAIMIGDILEYYDGHRGNETTTGFFSEYIEWIVFHKGTGAVAISEITSRKHRNVEKRFTEIWKIYGGTASFGSNHCLVVPPPVGFRTSLINHHITKWCDDHVQIFDYGYGDYFKDY